MILTTQFALLIKILRNDSEMEEDEIGTMIINFPLIFYIAISLISYGYTYRVRFLRLRQIAHQHGYLPFTTYRVRCKY